MERAKKRFGFLKLLAALIIGGEVFFILDMAFTRSSSNLSPAAAIAAFCAAFLVSLLIGIFFDRLFRWFFWVLTGLIVACALALAVLWYVFSSGGVYENVDDGKDVVFANRRVMVIVPHQDDEINLLGGVFEQYLSRGSKVYVVYVTNGDMSVDAQRRYAETIEGMARCGIPESDLIFLGYGDSIVAEDGQSMYFCPGDMVLTSPAGFTATYGTDTHPPFREGREYTLDNMYEDIRDVILRYRPDVIFCSEYDEHGDHRMVSLLFDRAMGEILRTHENYDPYIFKGFAYSTAYEAAQDFYSVNILSTIKPSPQSYMPESNVYNWNERLRLPVAADTLSRSMYSSSVYDALEAYASQYTTDMADGIINGDKVFWFRESSSECYNADVEITASSGNAALTHDFMLVDRLFPYSPITPGDNTWVPFADDEEKTLTIIFPEAKPIGRIKLYDNPSLEDNVLNVRVLFDDGTEIQSGPLPINGAAAQLEFEPKWVKSLELSLTETEGSAAGLTEVEAYSKPFDSGFALVKIIDSKGNFIYDYYMDESGQEDFQIYSWGCSRDVSRYRVFCIGDEGCSAKVVDGKLRVTCPEGKSCTVTVSNTDGSISDTVLIKNRSPWLIHFGQTVEQHFRKELLEGITESNIWKLLRSVYRLLPV